MRKSPGPKRITNFFALVMLAMLASCKTLDKTLDAVHGEIESVKSEIASLAKVETEREQSGTQSDNQLEKTVPPQQSSTRLSRPENRVNFNRLDDASLCHLALSPTNKIDWSADPTMFPYVTEARSRGYTPETCAPLASLDEPKEKKTVQQREGNSSSSDTGSKATLKTSNPFQIALHSEYTDLAEADEKVSDWLGSAYFSSKADLAGMGSDVIPTILGERKLPSRVTAQLAQARASLINKLWNGGGEITPGPAARAQAMFDCWIHEQGEGDQPEQIRTCRQAFQKALLKVKVRTNGLKIQSAKTTPNTSSSSPKKGSANKPENQPSKLALSENLETLKSLNMCLGCSLKNADLTDADLEGAKLSDSNIQGVNFKRAKLRGADFLNADLWKTNLENADLRDVNFKGARFMQVSLKGAKLAGANFQGADLRFVNLEGAQTDGANFDKAKLFGTAIKKPKKKSIKKQAGLERAGNRPSSSKKVIQKKSTRAVNVTDQVRPKETTQIQKSVSVSPSKINRTKRIAGDDRKELASLPVKEPTRRDQSAPESKLRVSKDNIRLAEGAATAIHAVGTEGRILAGFRGGKLSLIQLSDGKTIRRFKGHKGTIRAIAVDSSTQIFASGADDQSVRLWNLNTGKQIGVLKGHSKKVLSLSFSDDGKSLLSGSADKTVRVWNVAQQASKMIYKGHKGGVGAIVTLPGKPLAFSASASAKDRNVIRIWNYQNNVPLGNLSGHRSPVYALAVSIDGKTLVSGSKDKTLKIWDIKSKKAVKTLGVVEGHRGAIRSVAIADKGRLILSGSDDKTIIVWSAKSGEIIDQIKKHRGKILGMALSSDSKSLVSIAADKSVRIWRLVGNKYTVRN